MRHAIQPIQGAQIVRWRVVYEPAVFTSDEEMVSEIDISPSAVDERSSGLRAGPCRVLRIKDESTRASQDEGRPSLHGHPENIGRRDCIRIRIPPESPIDLRTPRPSLIRLTTPLTTL